MQVDNMVLKYLKSTHPIRNNEDDEKWLNIDSQKVEEESQCLIIGEQPVIYMKSPIKSSTTPSNNNKAYYLGSANTNRFTDHSSGNPTAFKITTSPDRYTLTNSVRQLTTTYRAIKNTFEKF